MKIWFSATLLHNFLYFFSQKHSKNVKIEMVNAFKVKNILFGYLTVILANLLAPWGHLNFLINFFCKYLWWKSLTDITILKNYFEEFYIKLFHFLKDLEVSNFWFCNAVLFPTISNFRLLCNIILWKEIQIQYLSI